MDVLPEAQGGIAVSYVLPFFEPCWGSSRSAGVNSPYEIQPENYRLFAQKRKLSAFRQNAEPIRAAISAIRSLKSRLHFVTMNS